MVLFVGVYSVFVLVSVALSNFINTLNIREFLLSNHILIKNCGPVKAMFCQPFDFHVIFLKFHRLKNTTQENVR